MEPVKYITYYLNGKKVTRRSSAPSKQRVKKDPAFQEFRGNGNEFGGSSTFAKSLRPGHIIPALEEFKDTYMVSRLNGKCNQIIKQGSGSFGQREASLVTNGKILEDFPLNKERPLGYVFRGPTKAYFNHDKTEVILETTVGQGYHAMNSHGEPWATVTMAIATVSNHRWNPKLKKYTPLNPTQNAWGDYIQSQPFEVVGQPHTITLSMPLQCSLPLDTTTAVVVYVGLRYHIQQGFAIIPVVTGSAMNIFTVLS